MPNFKEQSTHSSGDHVKIHIANLTRETSEEIIQKAFGGFGKVASVKLVIDKVTGKPSGFAFVDMPEEKEARAAIEGLHKKELNGTVITLKEVEEEVEGVPGFRPGRGPKGTKTGGPFKSGHGMKSTRGAHGGVVRRGGQRGV
jgi:cold-inducible RNA-binding protein